MPSPDLKVVPLAVNNLCDVPAMLRSLADQIEAGVYGQVPSMIALMPRDGEFPVLFGWGDVEGPNHPIIQCELAKNFLVENLVTR